MRPCLLQKPMVMARIRSGRDQTGLHVIHIDVHGKAAVAGMDVHKRKRGVGDVPKKFHHAVAAVPHTGHLESRFDDVRQDAHMQVGADHGDRDTGISPLHSRRPLPRWP